MITYAGNRFHDEVSPSTPNQPRKATKEEKVLMAEELMSVVGEGPCQLLTSRLRRRGDAVT